MYPPTCLLCGDTHKEAIDLCLGCRKSLPYNTVACPNCAIPLETSVPELCGNCQKNAPGFHSAFALFRYEEPVRYLIHSLKFGAHYPCARLLGALLAEKLATLNEKPHAIIPVPLHPSRYRWRGFNQATEIARTVSYRLGIPLDLRSCRRIRPTAAQAELTAKQRRRNVRNAFAVETAIQHRHVAILDDVITTCATVGELAKVLYRAGVLRVDVWACARA
ncbi:ComF family protein [Methylocaldum szegediense]|uniref:ComF family protein n=1 Tax=Methylocaldum szegediense TaxID=73780 RepID=UPI0004292D92|nr:ComF family protein [Methylocaldum szegediense]